MNLSEYFSNVAFVRAEEIAGEHKRTWRSKYDHSFITFVGLEEDFKEHARLEITKHLTQGLGFSPKTKMWYGWTHRGMCGFEIGSTCKKGDVHYNAANLEDEIESAINFWKNEDKENVQAKLLRKGELKVTWDYIKNDSFKDKVGRLASTIWAYDPKFGRGEWTAATLEEAKEMALDFRNGAS